MFKKFYLLVICLAVAFFISNRAFSQDDPSTTDPAKIENATDESKTEIKDELKKENTVITDSEGKAQTIIATAAKTYTDGKTLFVNSKVQFRLLSSDDFAMDKIEYKIDEAAVNVYGNPFSIETEGPHSIKYYGIDKVGNKEADKTYNVVVDNTGPSIVVTSSAPVKKIGDKVYFAKTTLFCISANDALSGVNKIEYSTDGTTYQEYAAPFAMPVKDIIDLKIRSIDNVDNMTEQFAFRVYDETGKEVELKDATAKLVTDDTAPVVAIKADKELKQINSYNVASTDVKYTVNATDEGSGVAEILYRLDGKGEFIPYTGEIQFLKNGKHQIDAKATDKMGNVSNIVSFTVYVDILPPVSSIETVEK
jgi:large repetitive protein